MATRFGCLNLVRQMEINAGVPEDYCQGNGAYLEPVELEEILFPFEDKVQHVKVKSIRLKRGKD